MTAAHLRQIVRFCGAHKRTNANRGRTRCTFCQLDDAGQQLMQVAMRQPHLSARGYQRVLKLARTIIDLADALQIGPTHLMRLHNIGRGGGNT